MTWVFNRETVVHITIALAVCVGGWVMVVEPMIAEVKELEATVAEVSPQVNPDEHSNLARIVHQLKSFHSRIEQVVSFNRLSKNPPQFYEAVLALAQKHGVTVDRLVANSVEAGDQGTAVDQVTTCKIVVVGGYDHVGGFLWGLDGLDGFIRPVALNVMPINDTEAGRIRANFDCELVCFSLPDKLVALTQTSPSDE
jgi:Tfp pilus assembly protein PilO